MFDLTRNQRDHTCRKRTCLLPFVVNVMLNFKNASCSDKKEVSGSSDRLHLKEQITGIPGTTGAAGLRQRHKTVRPTVSLYLNELLIQKCKFGGQFSRHLP